RNAALMELFENSPLIETRVVVDERSAAFQALGIAMITDRPVGVLCTSGTALLNLAPAICEAYYRQIPLIVLTADRQPQWIDQQDSQTMRQPGVYSNFIKASTSIDTTVIDKSGSSDRDWWANRQVNEMMIAATSPAKGPVHINIHCDTTLTKVDEGCSPRIINAIYPSQKLSSARAREMVSKITTAKRVLIVAGQLQPSEKLSHSLTALSKLPGVAIVAEPISNLHVAGCIATPNKLLITAPPSPPDLLITIGGSIVSKPIKQFLRDADITEHWQVGHHPAVPDTFRVLTTKIEMDPEGFFRSLRAALKKSMPVSSYNYKTEWADANSIAAKETEWNDGKAVRTILNKAPRKWNIQLSNGTTVRYAQQVDCSEFHRVDCNRGVSGIDGSTSTALGAASVYNGVTLLISGDMSAQYDVGALLDPNIDSQFKMAVINNGGGGIFRAAAPASQVKNFDRFFCDPSHLPLADIARGVNMAYFEASNLEELKTVFPLFAAETGRAAILQINTIN
ncbi:MAG: 2-succinyl-5-enolpyruvyl-6-hydroxy-3-cyclohexene-1-carboxylic-acid synthase, partial [Muribaculaceae bacterium]|nr:2-succinyl-5-enolpyruvyl-6-hydroxy-3-cyclohexene-1-carboxylic-acid synthase [Muribaculaceae bacterium]